MSSASFKLHLARSSAFLVFPIMLLFTGAAVVVITMTLRGSENVPPPFVTVLWTAVLAWNWFVVLGIPHTIEFNGPSDIVFISLRKTIRTSAVAIESIKSANGGMYVVRYDGGKIHLFQQFTGFYKLLSAIEAANPRFETRGI